MASARLALAAAALLGVALVVPVAAAEPDGSVTVSEDAPAGVVPPATPPSHNLLELAAPVTGVYEARDGTIYFDARKAGVVPLVVDLPSDWLGPFGPFELSTPTKAPGWTLTVGPVAPSAVSQVPPTVARTVGAGALTVHLDSLTRLGTMQQLASRQFLPDTAAPTGSVQLVAPKGGGRTGKGFTVTWRVNDGAGSGVAAMTLSRQRGVAGNHGCTSWKADGSPTTLKPDARPGATVSGSASQGRLTMHACYRWILVVSDHLGHARTLRTDAQFLDPNGIGAWMGGVDLFRDNAFATQATKSWCVGAATQLMVNLITGSTDRSTATQTRIQEYARATSTKAYKDGGADTSGWVSALRAFGHAAYAVTDHGTFDGSLRDAVIDLRRTNRPVGMLVMDGRHAWVLVGFTATADPAMTADFRITSVSIAGPLWPSTGSNGYDPAPDTRLSLDQLRSYFHPYVAVGTASENGSFVTINPQY